MAHRSKTSLSILFVAGVLGVVAACSSSKDRNLFVEPDAGRPADGFTDAGGDGSFEGCAKLSTKAEQLPLDMYIMLDQSLSMQESVSSGTKWSAITGALTAFINQPSLAGVGVGLGFFGLPMGGKTCSTTCTTEAECSVGDTCVLVPSVGIKVCSSCLDSCVPADYATPAVEIATLPGAVGALTTSIGAHTPSTLTPTSAALQGALDHAKEWADAHPDHVTVAVLATDGDPSECDLDLNHLNAIAADGLSNTPSILTFVIGVGSSFTALNGIAKAGGTTAAHAIDTTGNVNKQFLDALNKVRASLGCEYRIPAPAKGDRLDLDTVNVQYTAGGGTPKVVPKVANKEACPATGDAWYYDDNAAPTQILLCDSVCSKVSGDAAADVSIVIGCKTVVK